MNRRFDPSKFGTTEETINVSNLSSEVKKNSTKTESSETVLLEESEESEFLIDLSKEISDLEYTLMINGINTFPKGDIQMIKGKAKQGKTHLLLCIAAALLHGDFMNIKSNLNRAKICYFATEEHSLSVHKLAQKTHLLCGWNPIRNNKRFRVYAIRKQSPKERAAYIAKEVDKEKPDVVFIDGIRDLLNDFNNIHESNEVVGLLLRLSEGCNCSIVCVLHTNKSNFDSNMRGHLGTELLNKCSDVLEVTKNNEGVFFVDETESRNMEVGKFAFSLDENGLPKQVDMKSLEKKPNERLSKMKMNFSKILKDKTLSFNELGSEYVKAAKVTQNTAHVHIREAKKNGIIEQTNDRKYKLCEVTV